MAPEKPPRRAKTEQTPVTIDLAPNKPDVATTGSDPVAGTSAIGTGAIETGAVETGESPSTTTEPSVETVVTSEPTIETAAPDVQAPPVEPTDKTIDPFAQARGDADAVSGRHADDRIQDAAAAFAEEPASSAYAGSTSVPPHATTPPVSRASNTASLAAGIVGGLIALLAAGGLQYAGILPQLGPGGGGNRQALEALSSEVEGIKSQLAATPPVSSQTVDLSPLDARIAKLESATPGDSNAALPALTAQLDALNGEIAALKAQIADTRQTTDAAKSELSTRIDAAEKKLDAPASDVQLARAVAVTALRTAIDKGGPFLAELDALRSIAANDPAVTGLAEDAATGVAARKDLTAQFPDVADAMLGAIRGSDPNQGVFSRLMDSAASVVRVRPVGSVEGAGPEAVVARIEDKLTNGDLKGATIEWQALPAEAKTAGADFKTRLDQRIRVEGLIDTAVSGALTPNQG